MYKLWKRMVIKKIKINGTLIKKMCIKRYVSKICIYLYIQNKI